MAGGKVLSHHKANTWKLHHLFANQTPTAISLFMQPEHHLGKKNHSPRNAVTLLMEEIRHHQRHAQKSTKLVGQTTEIIYQPVHDFFNRNKNMQYTFCSALSPLFSYSDGTSTRHPGSVYPCPNQHSEKARKKWNDLIRSMVTDNSYKFVVSTQLKNITLQGTNISHLGKRKIIFKMPFLRDMLVPTRVVKLDHLPT